MLYAYSLNLGNTASSGVINVKPNNLNFEDSVCIGATLSGVYNPVGCTHNTLTGKGKDLLEALLNGTSYSLNVTRLAIANDTTAQATATDTTLSGELIGCGFTNTTGTSSYFSNGNWNVTYTWTNTCAGSSTVNATGIYNSSSYNTAVGVGANLFAETTFTSVTLNQNDQINVTWGFGITG
jgi:hypothetical protein